MKRIYLLFASVVLSASLFAQADNYSPSVYMFTKANGPLDDTSRLEIIELYRISHQRGFQQTQAPNFILSGGKGFSLGISGFVNLRTAYDFDGRVDNLDFPTYNIPIPGNYASHSKLFMDASTTRLAFKATANNHRLGPIVSYIETDFRGGNGGVLRLRMAYVSFKGFLFGRNVTTFCDLEASPTTIDFQGPNAYTFNYNEMIRYTRTSNNHRWKMGVAIEMPQISATTNANLVTIPQRIPDVPLYAQYNWGQKHNSHLRASAVIRTLTYHNMAQNENHNATGYGVQLSNVTQITRKLSFTGQVLYGEGISPYVNDLEGNMLDMVPNMHNNSSTMALVPTLGWFGSLQYNFTPSVFMSSGYSQVRVYNEGGYYNANQYRLGQYFFVNAFWNITPSLQCAVEYLYGKRKNMDMENNHANRIQAMIQYNF